jgi:hypothetical protein
MAIPWRSPDDPMKGRRARRDPTALSGRAPPHPPQVRDIVEDF